MNATALKPLFCHYFRIHWTTLVSPPKKRSTFFYVGFLRSFQIAISNLTTIIYHKHTNNFRYLSIGYSLSFGCLTNYFKSIHLLSENDRIITNSTDQTHGIHSNIQFVCLKVAISPYKSRRNKSEMESNRIEWCIWHSAWVIPG